MNTLLSISENSNFGPNSTKPLRGEGALFTIENTVNTSGKPVTEGERVGQLLSERGWNLSKLVKLTGYSKGHLSNITRGIRPVTVEARMVLAKAFGLTVPEFLEGVVGADELLAQLDGSALADYPDVVEFQVMLLDARKRNPGLARLVMDVGRQIIEREERFYQEQERGEQTDQTEP